MKSGHTKSCGCFQKYKVRISNRKYNTYIEYNNYYKCFLNNGNFFIIDKEDKEIIDGYCWREDSNGYIMTTINGNNIYLHKMILDMPEGKLIDHKNHKVYDYRKNNLRIVTQSKNQMNAKLRSNNSSGITGVYWSKERSKWVAQLKIDGKNMNLGGYINFQDACVARKKAEEKYFGKYSYDNSLINNDDISEE